MGNIISGFLSPETLNSIVTSVGGEAKFIWDLEDNLDALQTEFKKLIQTRDDLLNESEVAEQQPQTRRTNLVQGWLERVQLMETKFAELQKLASQEIDRLCLGGFCSKSLISSYNTGKKVAKLKQEVIELKDERGDIKDIAEKIPEDPAVAIPVEQTIVGQESILDQVWRWITESKQEVGIIGLYGTGGVGKTTLLKQINNHFRNQRHHFDVVIWAVVSKEPKLKQIQDAIGKRIGLSDESWQNKSLEDRALDISNILSKKNFVLLLDDVWRPIDLIELGIPLQSLNIASKVVFTTRSFDVCCQLKANNKLQVSCLGPDEAWKLFQEEIGREVINSHARIPELAKTLAKECGGLPIALKTIGRAMASRRNPEEWKRAINKLRTSASKFSGMEEKVFSSLKFSYDSLPGDETRSCLLYCCLFPEDFEIPKTELINYWIGEGFLNNYEDGYTIIGDLISACLLEEEDDLRVKMHDVIRDMALWIACKIEKEKENFLVRAGVQLNEAPNTEEWEKFKRISLMENKIESLSEIPTCPRLQTLLLNENEIKIINDGFFQFMPCLRVLSLSGNDFGTELPSGISSLVSLQYLDLSFTDICGLPQELKALVNLRYLNLDNTSDLSMIPHQLISSFSKLQVLRMMESGPRGAILEEGSVLSGDAECLLKELLGLKHLNLICLTLNGTRAVQNFLKLRKLVRITRSLSIRDCESPALNVLDLACMENLESLFIKGCDFEELAIDSTEELERALESGFGSLSSVFISSCDDAEDLTWLAFVTNLRFLNIWFCDDVEEIISGEKISDLSSEIMGELNLFAQLEILGITGLENLESIYWTPLPFPKLKEIRVTGCPNLKKLPLNSSSAREFKMAIIGSKAWWEDLEWEDQATQNAFSTCFVHSDFTF